MTTKKAAIIGASGYTGSELIRILSNHPKIEIVNLIGNKKAGQDFSNIYPNLSQISLPKIQKIDDIDFTKLDIIFCCLPHTTSQNIIKDISSYNNLKIIDLSADFRLKDPKNYQKWYKNEHLAKDLQKKSVYGLSEIYNNDIKKSSLIACPGCYPTSILLPLIPLLKNQLIDINNIIVDSKSGFSGAGKKLDENNLFCEINNSIKAYGIGSHRHLGEIEQELSLAANQNLEINFTPHILPINRGIISTIYLDLANNFSVDDLKNCLATQYEDSPFVNLSDNPPAIKEVIGSNLCKFSIHQGRNPKKAIIISVIDNLVKGASGQAVQNANIMFDFDERMGLTQIAMAV
jgi:N-acetyl-gamma-glutamyl-phosphate reductase